MKEKLDLEILFSSTNNSLKSAIKTEDVYQGSNLNTNTLFSAIPAILTCTATKNVVLNLKDEMVEKWRRNLLPQNSVHKLSTQLSQ